MKNGRNITIIVFLVLIILVFSPASTAAQDENFVFLPIILKNSTGTLPSWKVVSSPVPTTLNDVQAIADNDVWVVGDGSKIYHWDGISWKSYETPEEASVSAIKLRTPAEGLALSYSIYRWNGTSWSLADDIEDACPGFGWYGKDIDIDGENYWLINSRVYGPPLNAWVSRLFKWNETSKIGQDYEIDGWLALGIDMISASDGWAVGMAQNDPSGAIYRWNGGEWIKQVHPEIRILRDVSAFDSSHGWAVGEDLSDLCTTLFWNGISWVQINCPTADYFKAVDFASRDKVWAVGDGGVISFSSGGNWTTVPSPVTSGLLAIDMISEYEGWAVGENGVILHYTSGTP